MRSLLAAIALALALAPAGALSQSKKPPPVPAPLKVSVAKDGAISVDGKPATLDELAKALDLTKARGGEAWFYRDRSAPKPPPQADAAMKLVFERGIALGMSVQPDFSDLAQRAKPPAKDKSGAR